MARRQHLTLTLLMAVVFVFSFSYLYSTPDASRMNNAVRLLNKVRSKPQVHLFGDTAGSFLSGESIAPKLENAILKAELGRATWKFLHTVTAKYPDKPTPEDRKTLELFFLTFSKLYPCGDCARHFRSLLKEMPPQTSSRNAAAGWLCEAHNRVNKRLQKPVFDCSKIGDFYDCGCGDGKGKNDKDI